MIVLDLGVFVVRVGCSGRGVEELVDVRGCGVFKVRLCVGGVNCVSVLLVFNYFRIVVRFWIGRLIVEGRSVNVFLFF